MSKTDLDLTGSFEKALELLENSSDNLFITGKAGTGKSTLLAYFLSQSKKKAAVLAPTGVAALNVAGETIHSFFHFKSHITLEEAKKKGRLARNKALYRELELIIIDEISMVRADLLDSVDAFLKAALKNKKPFGGIRMIFIGDLYQLPPVLKNEEKPFFQKLYPTPYFFSAAAFQKEKFQFLELDKIFRQKEALFVQLLNAIRNNTVQEEELLLLNRQVLKAGEKPEEGSIYLTSTNSDAEKINRERLEILEGKERAFEAQVEGQFSLKEAPTESSLKLKAGAQVMFLNNHPQGLWVNGTLGRIVSLTEDLVEVETAGGDLVFVEKHRWELFKYGFDEKKNQLFQEEVGAFLQFPLRLAWAVTIHKSQGKSFEKVVIDLGRGAFAFGQSYVALSRCRTLEGLKLQKPFKKQHVLCDWRVVSFLTSWQYALSEKRLPLAEKKDLIQKAILEKRPLDLIYLKNNDEKSRRRVLPLFVGEMAYGSKHFLGLEAFCFQRNEKRHFKLERILEISFG
ncbi:MAG: AAA family ATPase [Parachlamydiales bacterium]|jgi:ATP-dependent exoDNAse (exonuclease V) alpha subunit